jgi:hypothetical protein
MDKTRDAVVQQAELRWDWEHRPDGEVWEFECGMWGCEADNRYDTNCPSWQDTKWYRRKPEPEKPFRAWVNVYPELREAMNGDGLYRPILHGSKESVNKCGGDRLFVATVLPADELAELEREHESMKAALDDLYENQAFRSATLKCLSTYEDLFK